MIAEPNGTERASDYLQEDQTRTTDSQLSSEKWRPFSFEFLEPIIQVVNTRVFYSVFRLRDAGDPK